MNGDPAVEAAKRGVGQHHWWLTRMDDDLMVSVVEYASDSAREALGPIRELHRPVSDGIGLEICAECSHRVTSTMWPCATARLIYSAEELS